jgi:hypothetical protein
MPLQSLHGNTGIAEGLRTGARSPTSTRKGGTPRPSVSLDCSPRLSRRRRHVGVHRPPGAESQETEVRILLPPLSIPASQGDWRMFTARATTMTARERLIADWTSISIFAQRLSGIVSVGLKADAFVNET